MLKNQLIWFKFTFFCSFSKKLFYKINVLRTILARHWTFRRIELSISYIKTSSIVASSKIYTDSVVLPQMLDKSC